MNAQEHEYQRKGGRRQAKLAIEHHQRPHQQQRQQVFQRPIHPATWGIAQRNDNQHEQNQQRQFVSRMFPGLHHVSSSTPVNSRSIGTFNFERNPRRKFAFFL